MMFDKLTLRCLEENVTDALKRVHTLLGAKALIARRSCVGYLGNQRKKQAKRVETRFIESVDRGHTPLHAKE